MKPTLAALMEAIKSDNLEAFEAALRDGPGLNKRRGIYTPLTRIAEETPEKNGVKMTELLLKAGADPNLKDPSRHLNIPLEYAVVQLRGIKAQKDSYSTQEEYEKDLKPVVEVIQLLYAVTSHENLRAVHRDYNGVIPSEIVISRKQESLVPANMGQEVRAGKRKNKKNTNKRRKTTKRRKTLKKF